MSKLSGPEIVKQRDLGAIVIDPFVPEHVGPNSVDLTLSPNLLLLPEQDFDLKKPPVTEPVMIPPEGLWLLPENCYLGVTNERAGANGFVPGIEGRSSIARYFLSVHETAGFGDDGFTSRWTLEISVKKRTRIYPHMRICQVYFEPLIGERKPYKGKYQNDSDKPIESRSYLDFEGADEHST